MAGIRADKVHYPVVEALLDRIAGWVRFWQDVAKTRSELARCGSGEVARMAHELGLTSRELETLTRNGPHAADLLPKMMEALQLDASRADLAITRDLQRLCAACDQNKRCAKNLRAGRAAAQYHDYCRNADTLDELMAG